MSNKLSELTEALYKEGVEKGNREYTTLVEKAKADAKKIMQDAEAKAKDLVAKAEKEASDKIKKVNAELKLSSEQLITKIKNEVTGAISLKDSNLKVEGEFLQNLILKIVESWDKASTGAIDIKMILPQNMQGELEKFIKKNCSNILSKGPEIEFSGEVKSKIVIRPKDGSYFIEFSDDSFKELLTHYLRPLTKEILFS